MKDAKTFYSDLATLTIVVHLVIISLFLGSLFSHNARSSTLISGSKLT